MRIDIDIGQLNVLAQAAGIVGYVRQILQETTKAFLPTVRYARSRGPMPVGCRQVEPGHQGSSVVIEKSTFRVVVRIDRHERRKCRPLSRSRTSRVLVEPVQVCVEPEPRFGALPLDAPQAVP